MLFRIPPGLDDIRDGNKDENADDGDGGEDFDERETGFLFAGVFHGLGYLGSGVGWRLVSEAEL